MVLFFEFNQAFKLDGRQSNSYAYTVKKIYRKKRTERKKEKSMYYHKLLKRVEKKKSYGYYHL